MMRWMLPSAVLLVGWALAARAEESAEVNGDLAKFQGVWQLTSMEDDGQAVPPDVLKTMVLYIYKNEYVFKIGEKTAAVGTFSIDPLAKTITRTDVGGKVKGMTYLGIYALQGETMKVCWSGPGVTLTPAGFESKPGSACCYDQMKRLSVK